MSTTFPRAKGRRGYDIDEVEAFLEDARLAYTGEPGAPRVTAESIRRIGFRMRRGGYSPAHVDSALERLEDAFAAREREHELARLGDHGLYQRARGDAEVLLDRFTRRRGTRFRRVGLLSTGYSVRYVDDFTDRVVRYLTAGAPLSADDVRGVAFPAQRGGYHEGQVDIVLDAVIDVLQSVEG